MNSDNHSPSDDALRAALTNEVPAPAPGYWDEIDARLQSAAADRAASQSGVEVPEINPDTDAPVIRLTDMNNTTTLETSTPASRFRPLLLVAAAAVVVIVGVFGIASLRNTTSTVEVANDPDPADSTDGALVDDEVPVTTEPDVVLATEVSIVIADEFAIENPILELDPIEFESGNPDLAGTLCESGLEARHPELLPQPSAQATGRDPLTGANVEYLQFVLESPEEVASVMEMWGEGRCEATFETVDGVPTEGTLLFADEVVDIPLPAGYDTAAIELEVNGGMPVGILVIGAGNEIVLAVAADPPVPAEIPRILETAASAYS